MSREVQVRFCEGRAMRSRPATHLSSVLTPGNKAEQVKARLAGWLAPRGLVFNEDTTKIVPLSEGFDFLGVKSVRQLRLVVCRCR
jgi:RNA-directed DNA polymerase